MHLLSLSAETSSVPASASELPLVLAGPILRRVTPDRLTLWLATREAARVRIELSCGEQALHSFTLEPGGGACQHLVAGAHLHYLLIDLPLATALSQDRWIGYAISLQTLAGKNGAWRSWAEWAPDLCYPGKSSPGFVLPARVGAVLHGSCRKPHFAGGDGLRCKHGVRSPLLPHLPASPSLASQNIP